MIELEKPFVIIDGDILLQLFGEWQLEVGTGHVQLSKNLTS